MASYNFSKKPKKVKNIHTKYRKIQTSIPVKGTEDIIERMNKVESRSMHGQLPLVWNKAKDFNVYDSANNSWIDFTSTIFVTNIGHSNTKVISHINCVCSNYRFFK